MVRQSNENGRHVVGRESGREVRTEVTYFRLGSTEMVTSDELKFFIVNSFIVPSVSHF